MKVRGTLKIDMRKTLKKPPLKNIGNKRDDDVREKSRGLRKRTKWGQIENYRAENLFFAL